MPRRHNLDRRADRLAEEGAGEPDDLLSTRALAAWFGVTQEWAEIGRHQGYGPPFVKVGERVVRYRRSDVLAWLKERTRLSTTEYAVAQEPKGRRRGRVVTRHAR